MKGWLTYPEFLALYPSSDVTEADFPALAALAAQRIQSETHWRASHARGTKQLKLLAFCQAQLIQLSADTKATSEASLAGVTSVSNHGYSESYASAQQMQTALEQRQSQIIQLTLSAPATCWMLYKGGLYRPPRCR